MKNFRSDGNLYILSSSHNWSIVCTMVIVKTRKFPIDSSSFREISVEVLIFGSLAKIQATTSYFSVLGDFELQDLTNWLAELSCIACTVLRIHGF